MFKKPNAIIYVRRSGLVLAGKRLAPARTSFDDKYFENMEVLNHEGFIAHCQQFFEEHGLKGKHILMVLDNSIIFSKSSRVENASEAAQIRDDFLAAMPLEPGTKAIVSSQSADGIDIYATNSDIYTDITEAIHRSGAGRLLAITPATAYDTPDGGKLSAAIQTYVNDTAVRGSSNFMSANLL
jgi:hypothetical protein